MVELLLTKFYNKVNFHRIIGHNLYLKENKQDENNT